MQEQIKDEFEVALDVMLVELQNCQHEKMVDSCMKCSKILDCFLRKKYVDSVYISMNKGHGGGFEF